MEVIDSLLVLMTLGLIVIAAARKPQAGVSLEQVINTVNKALPKVHVRMAIDTLDYVREGGRIGRLKPSWEHY